MQAKVESGSQIEATVSGTGEVFNFIKDEDFGKLYCDEDLGEFDWDQIQADTYVNSNTAIHSKNLSQNNKNRGQLYNHQKIAEFNSTFSNFPSFSDIQKSLQVVRKAFPETFTDQVIDSLFRNLMEKCSNSSKKVSSPVVLQNLDFSSSILPQNQKLRRYGNQQKMIPARKRYYSQPIITPVIRTSQKIKQQNIVPLQSSFVKSFKHCKGQKDNIEKGIASRLDKIWNQQYEQLLLNLYKKGHQFSFIRDTFQQEYQQYRQIFSVNSLRGRFYKIIRQTVRKYQIFIEQIGIQQFPTMIKLSYNIIQNIMYFREGRELRNLLVDLYFCDRLNKGLIDRIIENLHKFIDETKHHQSQNKKIIRQ